MCSVGSFISGTVCRGWSRYSYPLVVLCYLHIYYQKDECLGKSDKFSDAVHYLSIILFCLVPILKNYYVEIHELNILLFYHIACSNVLRARLISTKTKLCHLLICYSFCPPYNPSQLL